MYRSTTFTKNFLIFLLMINKISALENELAKIFRTPKDMSKVNFDHLEIVERASLFDSSETLTTTTTESSASANNNIKKNGDNIANAQVLLKIGGDDHHHHEINSHIMRIPPLCRNLPYHPADYFYPPIIPSKYSPSCHHHHHHQYPPHQLFHPYPPPVPFIFPNYYYSNYGYGEDHFLPPQLREYFGRHPEFLKDKFPENKKYNQVFVWGRPLKKEDITINTTTTTMNAAVNVTDQIENLDIMKTRNAHLNITNEDIEATIVEKIKGNVPVIEKKMRLMKKPVKNNKKRKNSHKKQRNLTRDYIKELSELLQQVIGPCQCEENLNNSINYPIINEKIHNNEADEEVINKKCSSCSYDSERCNCDQHPYLLSAKKTKKTHKQLFEKDLDDLITIIVEENADDDLEKNATKILKDIDGVSAPSSSSVEIIDIQIPATIGNLKPTILVYAPSSSQMMNFSLKSSYRPINILTGNNKISENSKTCIHCNQKNSNGNFCEHCGQSLKNHNSDIKICSSCTKEVKQINEW